MSSSETESTHEELLELLLRLRPLVGSWQGCGSGHYPTIDSFEYDEQLTFSLDERYPMIAYEQKTTLKATDAGPAEASHWECGFLRPVEGKCYEISNVQDSGRVEVLRARADQLVVSASGISLEFNSIHLGHDPRLQATRRHFEIAGEELRYHVFMATHTTERPELQDHLRASLRRQ